MHQHPAQAPRGPKSLSTSFQAAEVRTAVVSAIDPERCHGRARRFQGPRPRSGWSNASGEWCNGGGHPLLPGHP
jgi:hypothetical protein